MRFIKNDPGQLADRLRSLGQGLVCFDGRLGAGKNHMANLISERVPCEWFDTDDFVKPSQRQYVAALNAEALRDRVRDAFATSPIVVVAGACARQVVERAQLSASLFVWIERSSFECLEIDERDFADDRHSDVPKDWLLAEIENYVATSDARIRADIVYLNAFD
jgi:hypothetical protein